MYRQFYKFMRTRLGGRNPTLELVSSDHVREFLTIASKRFDAASKKGERPTSSSTKLRRLSAISALYVYFSKKREPFPITNLKNPTLDVSVDASAWSPKSIKLKHREALKAADVAP